MSDAVLTPQQDDLLEAFSQAIFNERVRAHVKHGKTSMEHSPLLHHRRASILVEEAVECMRALNDHEHGDIVLGGPNGPGADRPVAFDELDKELIQTAAMAYTWWVNRRGDVLPAPEEPDPLTGSGESFAAVELLRKVIRTTYIPMPLRREIEQLLAPPEMYHTFTKVDTSKFHPGVHVRVRHDIKGAQSLAGRTGVILAVEPDPLWYAVRIDGSGATYSLPAQGVELL